MLAAFPPLMVTLRSTRNTDHFSGHVRLLATVLEDFDKVQIASGLYSLKVTYTVVVKLVFDYCYDVWFRDINVDRVRPQNIFSTKKYE